DGKAPASSWAAFGPAGVVATGAAGDEAVGPVPDAGTAFRVASCTKSFTAATLLTFVAEGALALETPLTEVLDATVLGASRATIAEGFARVEGEWTRQPWAEPGSFSALGGVIATPTALATWAGWLASAWRDDATDAVLSVELRRAMQAPRTPVPASNGTHYGL